MIGPGIFESRAARPFLALGAAGYRAAVGLRNALYDGGRLPIHRLPCLVVSLGNLTVGGTGKTPLTSHVASFLRESGYRVGIVSRGYGRRRGRSPLLVSDGRSLLADAASAGDEPCLMARDNPAVPVAVGADRVAAARLLMRLTPCEVLLLDDAFQHRRLARDIDLLLVDGRDPWGNGKMLPRGPLREPVDSLARADALVVTRSDGRGPEALRSALGRHHPGVPQFHCRLVPRGFVKPDGETVGPAALHGFSAYAFSGIARPERFEDDLKGLGLRIAATRRFPDHHAYRRRDLEEIGAEARLSGADVLVTTEKDLVRIVQPPEGPTPLYALAIQVFFPWKPGLHEFLLDRLGALRPGPGRPA